MKNTILPFLCLSICLSLTTPCHAKGLYHLIKEIPIAGPGGWDYLTVDSDAARLYVSRGTEVVVVDLNTDAVMGEITNTPGVHGIAIAPELGRGFVSDGRENKAAIVDLKTLQILDKVDAGKNPDGLVYEPGRQEVYLFNGKDNSATVLDTKSGAVVATIPLPGKPEFCAADPDAQRVYDNIEDQSVVVAIDTKTHAVKDTWPIAPGEEASGMAFDAAHHRLFIGCHNKQMVMMDTTTGKVVGSVPIGDGVDANAFDPGTQLAFASCGDGTVTIAHEDTPDRLSVSQTLTTEKSARTMALDPRTHQIYLATAKFEAPAPGERRGKMVSGTFKILIYAMD